LLDLYLPQNLEIIIWMVTVICQLSESTLGTMTKRRAEKLKTCLRRIADWMMSMLQVTGGANAHGLRNEIYSRKEEGKARHAGEA